MDKMVRVGAVQAEPVWLDLDGSVDKTIALIKRASADGVQVLGFPEVWIPGYPW
jgi:predicted amidohydrolase